MSSRVSCAAVACLVASLVVGCNQDKPVPGVKGLPKWEAEPAERRLAELTKSLDTWTARIAHAEDKTLSHEQHLDAVEAALTEHDRATELLTAATKDLESAMGSVHFDPPRYERFRAQLKKELERYGELGERLSKTAEQFPADREKGKGGK